MLDWIYAVVLNTPLGKRNGLLALHITGKKVDGYLELFQHREAVFGEMRGNGTCWLRGKFVTLMNEFYYEAVGRLNQSNIELTLHGRHSEYQLLGTTTLPMDANGGAGK